MSDSIYTYSNISISPYKFQKILEFKLSQELNEHAKLTIRGIIDEEKLDEYVENSNDNEKLEVSIIDENSTKILFKGIVTNILIDASNNVRTLSIEAMSETILMDIKKKSRSFQDEKSRYSDIFKTITKEYENASVIDESSKGKMIEGLFFQYNETDWEFIKRLASHLNSGLVAKTTLDGCKYYVGICNHNESLDIDEFNYSIKKDIRAYKLKSENGIKEIKEQNAISYEVITNKFIELCSVVEFKNRILYVFKSEIEIKDGLFLNRYILRDENGMKRPKSYNKELIGVSIEGNVIGVSKDRVQIHLNIDKEQIKDKAIWFPYSTVYSSPDGSGWYCMPEIKDKVRLYFPDQKEKNAIVASSVNINTKENKKRSNPSIKRISTKYGKQVVFKPGAIEIIGNGKMLIRLTDDGGIEINSNKKISISAEDDIEINGGTKVVIQGDLGVDLKQANATLSILEDVTISGAKVNIE